MRKLNRKGFTLVELLAVIVILAIVVGITLVTILPTLENSRKKSFDVAVETIRNYIQDQRDMSLLSSDLQGDTYNSAVGTTQCTQASQCDGSVGSLLVATGYDKNISAIKWYVDGGVVKISCATANTETGDYAQSSNYEACK